MSNNRMKSLIFLEVENVQNAIDLLEVVRQMTPEDDCETYAIWVGPSGNQETAPIDQAIGMFDFLIQIQAPDIQSFDIRGLTNALAQVQAHFQFDSILIPATYLGRMLAPSFAMRLHVGLVADVTEIQHTKGQLEMIRPAFSGKIMAAIVNKGDKPVMMSVRENVFRYEGNPAKKTETLTFQPTNIQPATIKLLEVTSKTVSKDIRESDVLISGGGGVLHHFQKLTDLAEAMNGQVAASRRIVDNNVAPRAIQVGQSGKTVSPKLYMALGIYGALQHIEGLKNVETIISVNTNKDAPICSMSDIVVEGDAVSFVEKLVEKIREQNSLT